MGTFSTSLTGMTSGTSWNQVSLINEIITAIRNRTYSLTGSYGSISTISSGSYVQNAAWIRSLQSWCETYYSSFCKTSSDLNKPTTGSSSHAFLKYNSTDMGSASAAATQFSTDAGLNVSGTPSNWWTRKAPGVDTVGAMQSGDYIGWWTWKQLAKALQAMSVIRDNTFSFVNIGRSWLDITVGDLYWDAWIVNYRGNDPALWKEWGYVHVSDAINATDALNVRNNAVSYFRGNGSQFIDMYANAGYPTLPYGGPALSNGVWMYSALSVTNYGTNASGNESYPIQGFWVGYSASLGMCHKAISGTFAKLWPGTATRKAFIMATCGWDEDFVARERIPQNLLDANKHVTFGGSAHYYIPPGTGRGGGNSPITTLQNGWNAIYSIDQTCSASSAVTRNITDPFQASFADYDQTCPWNISYQAHGRTYMKGWHSTQSESYLFIPNY